MPNKGQLRIEDVWIGQGHIDAFASLTGRDLRNSRGIVQLLEKAINAINLQLTIRRSPEDDSFEISLQSFLDADFGTRKHLYRIGSGRRAFLSQFQAWLQA